MFTLVNNNCPMTMILMDKFCRDLFVDMWSRRFQVPASQNKSETIVVVCFVLLLLFDMQHHY